MGLLVLDGGRGTAPTTPDTYPAFVEKVYRPMAARVGVELPRLDVVSGEPLPAIVNSNRWIVECPDCNGAEMAWKQWPLFVCATCWNGAAEVPYTFRPVRFPEYETAIERVLMARPVPATRNWLPGESVADLEAENAAHGLPKGGE
jgi:hypothetical protein